MTLGGCPLHWVSNLHTEIYLSILEAEYIALSQAMRDLLPFIKLLQEVGTQLNMEFASLTIMHSTLFDDNNGALGLVTSPRKTPRMRHIAVKYHLFREHVSEVKGIMIQRVEFKDQKSDIFTKVLPV